jgi:hypothetical protein
MKFDHYKELVAESHTRYIENLRAGIAPLDAAAKAGWDEMNAIAKNHLEAWDMACVHDVIKASMPKADKLTLYAQSEEVIEMKGYKFKVKIDPQSYATSCHFSFHAIEGEPFPISETGYRSEFVPITAIVTSSILDFISHIMKDVEVFVPDPQLSLF